MSESAIIALVIYSIGLVGWYLLVGFSLLNKIKLLYFPFLTAQFVFIVNIVLSFFAVNNEYSIELKLYPYVENNSKAVASLSLAIAVFWVFVSNNKKIDETNLLVKLFLWLLFWAFLISVIGALPLYWVPAGGQWLTALRHLKSVPYFYSLFILSSALVVFLYKLGYRKDLVNQVSTIEFRADDKSQN